MGTTRNRRNDMLFNLDELKGMKLLALDGDIGKCVDFLFDDRHWVVRYMDARAGNWLTGRRVLISPISLNTPDWEAGKLPVKLSREQIKDCPSLAEDQPVSREFEREFFSFYGYGFYWMGGAPWGAGILPAALENLHQADSSDDRSEKNHLRSLKEVDRYRILYGDEQVGELEGVLVDGHYWTIQYLVVYVNAWLAHDRVIVPPRWIGEISWSDHSLSLEVERGLLESVPGYSRGAPVAPEDESRYRSYFNGNAA
jgi:hypothetical protein